MPVNPERMRPTALSMAPHVIEANTIVFQAANGIIQKQMDMVPGKRNIQLLITATRFLRGIYQEPKK